MTTREIPFNVNSWIKVKLTEEGIRILTERNQRTHNNILKRGGKGLSQIEPRIDEDGYYKTQLWMLMEVFGPHMELGLVNPFDTNIILVGGGHE